MNIFTDFPEKVLQKIFEKLGSIDTILWHLP